MDNPRQLPRCAIPLDSRIATARADVGRLATELNDATDRLLALLAIQDGQRLIAAQPK